MVLPLLLLAFAISLLTAWLQHHADLRLEQKTSQRHGEQVADLVALAVDKVLALSPRQYQQALNAAGGTARQALLVKNGLVLASLQGNLQGQALDQLPEGLGPLPSLPQAGAKTFHLDNQSLFVRPLAAGVSLLLWTDTAPLAERGTASLLSIVAGVSLLAALVMLISLRRTLFQPLEKLLETLHRRVAGDHDARVGALEEGELGLLGLWLDKVLEEEQEVENRLQQIRLQSEEQEILFRRIFKIMPDLVSITRLSDGRLINVNERWEQVTGWRREEALGHTTLALGLWRSPAERQQLMLQLKDKLMQSCRFNFLNRWGDLVEVEASGCVFEEQGESYLLLSFRDIGERLRKERDLRLLAQVVEVSLDGVMITDANQHILAVNSAFSCITGYAPEEVIGQLPNILNSGIQDQAFYQTMWEKINLDGLWQGEIWNKRKSGDVYPQWLSIRAVKDDQGEVLHYVGVFSDLSDRKAAEDRIAFLAFHDPLTGLPNRTLLVDRCEQALLQAKRDGHCLALIYLDLDRFKAVNDSLGHDIGDTLLNEVVARIQPLCRDGDTLSRQGGDEFLLLLPRINETSQVELVVERILAAMSEPFLVGGHRLWISTSIGVAVYPDDGDNVSQLLRKADTALYHAKDSGRSTFSFFTRDMDKDLSDRLQLESALKDAIGTDQLCLHYQPQIHIASGQIIGVEALMRWNSPTLGQVSPAKFIPLAEDTGLIMPLGAWSLQEACRQLATWRLQGFDGTMAVNISVRQLIRPDFFDLLEAALAQSGLPADRLELELTESLMMDNVEASLEVVRRLKALDVTLSIDDFGTGYSSLSYLKRFAVDNLKIDQSFIKGLSDEGQARSLVRAIVQMAHSLDLQVVAEGVETKEQLAILKAEKVDVAQGYLLGRPMAAEALSELLASQLLPLPALQ
ncbi:EAL domain-containing protein [Gallaecimonas kandeliae]|uniref:EAL domain-containing protein n=1 Tax=Gallaecimonas kandeliae TaxID=3029055 RepID=UPI002647251A|nr:EAL domain-containing protein [Gallaecimonas kandeliae]WKE66301.1 EAL domain-containing protein [Gallaecimonas kandeliae]